MVRSAKKRESVDNIPDKENAKKIKTNPALADNALCKLVMSHGFIFPVQNDQPNELSVDQAMFIQKVSSTFKKGREKAISTIIDGLEELWSDNYRFCFSILPTVTSDDCLNSSRGKQQDSLLRLLLGIEALQTPTINALLEKLPEISMNSELTNVAVLLGDLDLVHRLVSQLRWQDKIYNNKQVITKVLEIISISDAPIQKELISCIPDFVDDGDHADIASQLSQLMMENSHLVSSLLDALTNLNLKGDTLIEIQDTVMKILESADLADLPLVVKFLQQSLTDVNRAFEIVSTMREKLDFKSIGAPKHSSTQHGRNNSSVFQKTRNDESIIFDVVKTGIRFQKLLGDTWMKVIESISSAKDHKIIDIFVILVLHGIKQKRKVLDTLIRNKVKTGVFTDDVVTATFSNHHQIFNEHIKEILLLAELLLRSPEVIISNYGCNIYKQAFCSFDMYSQQEVIGALVTHIGSGVGPEIESAFITLQSLVDEQTNKMSSFTIFLKGILDYIDNLTVSQIGKLFSMISKLCYTNDESSESILNDDMYVIIRKQLSSVVLKYKRIGIVGSMMVIKNLANVKYEVDFVRTLPGATAPAKVLSDGVYKQVVEILNMVKGSVKDKPEPSSIFYDELANIIEKGDIDPKVLSWVQETVVADFQDEFLIDVDVVKKSTDPQIGLVYDLDEPEEGGIAVNILPLLLADLETANKQAGSSTMLPYAKNKLICLPALFRLVRICEQKQNKGNVEGIDALLGCPLVLFGEDALNQYSTMKEQDRLIVCSSLFHAVNWFREVLNSFCGAKVDADTRAKIIYRIKTLNTLCTALEKCLSVTPNFEVPIADYSIDDKLLSDIKSLKKILESGKQPKKPKKSKPKKKTTKGGKDVTTANDATAANDATTANEATSTATEEVNDDNADDNAEENNSDREDCDETDGVDRVSESAVSLAMFPASLRQLDLQIFHALSYGSVCKKHVDSEMHTKDREEVKLDPAEIGFLLKDLLRKLNHSLSGDNRRCFLKVSAIKLIGFSHLPTDINVIHFVVQIMPSLWNQLQVCIEYFQDLSQQHYGVVDISHTDETKEHIRLYQLLLQCILALFQWDGFHLHKHDNELKSIFTNILKESSEKDVATLSFQSLLRVLFDCLTISETSIPNIHIAVTLVKILSQLLEWYDGKIDLKTKMREMILKLLKYTWVDINGQKEKGANFNESLGWLIRKYVSLSDEPLKAIEGFCEGPVAELRECPTSNEEGTSTFPCMNRASFTSLYKSLFEELIAYTKIACSEQIVTSISETVKNRLNLMQTSLKLFQALNSVVKDMDSRTNLIISLKYSRSYLEIFLKSVMPLLDKTFRSQKDIVHGILKTAQQSTRSLQHLCGHSKISKDVSMTMHVPALKKCLETFVFRVKAMLAYNNCDSAFWLGNLKNRDLKGNEILSQVSSTDAQSDDDDNDDIRTSELPPEEDEDVEDDEEDIVLNQECSDSF